MLAADDSVSSRSLLSQISARLCGKVAMYGNGKNSPYTRNLIKAMEVPNRPVEIVFKEVRRTVQQETNNQQTPWENTSLSGDFYFKVQNN